MACQCKRKTASRSMRANTEQAVQTQEEATTMSSAVDRASAISVLKSQLATTAADDKIDLPQCYMCAKKHLSRAQIYFEEYHTGYPERLKILIQSLRVAEAKVNEAFQLYCKTMAHMDMAAGELLGNTEAGKVLDDAHIVAANSIRTERLKFQDDPLYIPDFEKLLTAIQLLQYAE